MSKEFLWVEKYRPKKIDDCILPESSKKSFQGFLKQGEIPNLLLSPAALLVSPLTTSVTVTLPQLISPVSALPPSTAVTSVDSSPANILILPSAQAQVPSAL